MKDNYDILIIDDEKVVIDSILKICELENYKTDFALNVSEALNKLESYEYKLIICDIMLPEIDGFQFLEILEKKNLETPVVMTTGYSTIENALKSLYLGAIDFISKPFTIDEMLSLLARGMKYKKYMKLKNNNFTDGIIVSCPANYFRLGISCWADFKNDGTAKIGATNFFIKTIEPISKIELMKNDDLIFQAVTCVKFICNDYLHNLYSSISGRIIELNEKLLNNPELIEKDPYFEGWIYRILPNDFQTEKNKLIPCGSDR